MQHSERHRSASIGWLRAAVLGADDGILSTASLVVGVAAAGSSRHQIMLAGAAGLVAGALSMAAGEYVSVSSQADTEKADLVVERTELATQRSAEERELASIYVQRGLDPELARTVAVQLMAHDALAAHARDELGITEQSIARPLQAALASAATLLFGRNFTHARGHPGAAEPPFVANFWSVAHLPGCPRRTRCAGRRSVPMGRWSAGRVLGRTRHGGYRGCRQAVRDCHLLSDVAPPGEFLCLPPDKVKSERGVPVRTWRLPRHILFSFAPRFVLTSALAFPPGNLFLIVFERLIEDSGYHSIAPAGKYRRASQSAQQIATTKIQAACLADSEWW